MQIYNCEQGSEEWFKVRMGIPTASCFQDILSKGRGSSPSETRRKYMLRLLGERLTGMPIEQYTNEHMIRGQLEEVDARKAYEFINDIEVMQEGFVTINISESECVGYSPDGLVGNNGIIEIKSKIPHLHLDWMLKDEIPTEHIAQIQGGLLIREREWCDFISYSSGLKPFIKRIYRDEPYIENLKKEIIIFLDDLNNLALKIKGI